ncbi:hypothetical protein [Scale drop disease virus]|uniref:Uncharacterized protein n=1 Tax=Scale drop disease virus TaxID=1697349 RepID=A0A7D5UKZ0_9VIRU|nr:hypothetical protein [Scale drop disease virus]QXJ13661.1 hypothetical protein PMJGCIOK_00094 [Scale drop disease virus]
MTRIFTIFYLLLCTWIIILGRTDARILAMLSLGMVMLGNNYNIQKKVIMPEYAPHQRSVQYDHLKELRNIRLRKTQL